MVKFLFSALAGATVACAQQLPTFESFIELHGRSYKQGSAEFHERKALYEQRKTEAETHNSDSSRLWTAGVNKLSDWNEDELKTLRGWDGSVTPLGSGVKSVKKHAAFLQQDSDLPETKTWTHLQTAQNIKNQGGCGSCWAIASSTVLEGMHEIYMGTPRTFSAQQIVECTPNPRHCGGDGGCQGATAELAMEWVLKNGCAEAAEVPYTAMDGTCTSSTDSALAMTQLLDDESMPSGGAAIGMTGWETLPKNEYMPLMRAVAEKGPVAVSVAAGQWFSYDSGIFNGCGKDSTIDHAVVAMGYGRSPSGTPFWIIQNSWGNDWGENGFIRMMRHEEGDYCGTNYDPQKGVACQGENTPVPVCGMCGILFDSVIPHFG